MVQKRYLGVVVGEVVAGEFPLPLVLVDPPTADCAFCACDRCSFNVGSVFSAYALIWASLDFDACS